MGRSIGLTREQQAYLIAHTEPLDEVARQLAQETRELTGRAAGMQVTAEHAQFLTLLARLLNARHAIEVGTFTGMSALAIARGMAPDGRLVCFDISEEYGAIARRSWARAGLTDRIELRVGDAAQLIGALPREPYCDFAFIDADKTAYSTYWNEIVPRLRSGGILAVDNVLWRGSVLDPPADDIDAQAIAKFNDEAIADDRVEVIMLPIGDGVTVARRR
jgi:caffeoyl-CoA O-methyltransferase